MTARRGARPAPGTAAALETGQTDHAAVT